MLNKQHVNMSQKEKALTMAARKRHEVAGLFKNVLSRESSCQKDTRCRAGEHGLAKKKLSKMNMDRQERSV